MAVAPNLGPGAGLASERVVRRHRAVRADADHLAVVIAEILRLVALEALAQRHEQIAVAGEGEARAEMQAARGRGLLAKNDLARSSSRAASSPGTSLARATLVPLLPCSARLRIGEVDQARGGEVGAERHVQQSALAAGQTAGTLVERRRQLAILADQPHAPGALRHQQAAVGQEGHAPGVHEPLGECFGLDRCLRLLRGCVGYFGRGRRQQAADERCGDEDSDD